MPGGGPVEAPLRRSRNSDRRVGCEAGPLARPGSCLGIPQEVRGAARASTERLAVLGDVAI
eukprot:2414647-Pyramimonas_sp.AAC.1